MKYKTDLKIKEVHFEFKKLPARQPIKFGSVVMDYVLYATVKILAENSDGKLGAGYGYMPFAHLWGWPKTELVPDKKDDFMCNLLQDAGNVAIQLNGHQNPFQIAHIIQDEIVRKNINNMPLLNILLAISPLDAAIHDAYGRIEEKSSYELYSEYYMEDLSCYLGGKYKNKYITNYINKKYKDKISVFHLIGGLDPLSYEDITKPVNDGLPETLEEWIKKEGIYCYKIKWRGNDLDWDIKRALDIFKIARKALLGKKLYFTGDTNEQCENPGYMEELLLKLKEKNKELFSSILYVEQPTDRDIWAHPFDFSSLAKIKPVLMDESLVDIETLRRGLELGITGIAVKTCKGHSKSLIYIAVCEEEKIPYAVQDLSLPGYSFVHSAGLAARINTIYGVEGNGRQYFPNGSIDERKIYPHIFSPIDGDIMTGDIKSIGLGF